MRKVLLLFLLAPLLAACELWNAQPQPFPVWTPIPSRTPDMLAPPPLGATETASPTQTLVTATLTSIAPTETPTLIATSTPAPITLAPDQPVQVDILGCNTGFDITHGMGEVTNAFVIVMNMSSLDMPNACALLRAIDEDREHPEKKRCVDNLPAGYQVTQKLTVDSAYKQDTIIQVDVSSDDVLLLRVDEHACQDINLFGGAPPDVGVIKPIAP